MKREYLSVNYEPALQEHEFYADPSEKTADAVNREQDEIDILRNSVFNEPAITDIPNSKILYG